MTYQSVDALQRTLADSVFNYTADRKKAAGRALGTLVEIVTYYTLRAWGLRDSLVIERPVPEFGNHEITHNVEFSLHPILDRRNVVVTPLALPLTSKKVARFDERLRNDNLTDTQLLSTDHRVRNASLLLDTPEELVVGHLDQVGNDRVQLTVCHLHPEPFAIFECKRVGVEEGMRKGPQTIEKAKQGAYVARSVSSLHKVRLRDGSMNGVLERADQSLETGAYLQLLDSVIRSNDPVRLKGFVLTVGVVSNHGNWFTAANQNKELRVLAQSYDWLLFLTDAGLSKFIDRLLLNPKRELEAARTAFLSSYNADAVNNRFTKVRVDLDADTALRAYFTDHAHEVEAWYNVIAPGGETVSGLRETLDRLARKNWQEVLGQ